MKNSNRSFIAFAIGVCTVFMSVLYFSCEKTGNAAICDAVVCHNGGYCLKGQCMCPSGFEDSTCSTSTVAKYIGTWSVKQTIIADDSVKNIGKDSTYSIIITTTATPSSFFIYNFLNNNEFNKVLCTLNSDNSYNFQFDTTTNAAMRFAPIHYWGGSGTIYTAHFPSGDAHPSLDSIVGSFTFKFVNPLHNWQVQKLKWVLTNHQP